MTNDVELNIYNMLGQKVVTLIAKKQKAGNHQVEWDASGFASGVYFYRIEVGDPVSPAIPGKTRRRQAKKGEDGRRRTGEFQDMKKMVLLR